MTAAVSKLLGAAGGGWGCHHASPDLKELTGQKPGKDTGSSFLPVRLSGP